MSLRLVDAGAEAADVLSAVHAGGIGEAGPGWSAAAFASLLRLPGRLAIVAARDAAPCGMLLAGLAADEAEVLTLAVLPAARRQGVGAALLRRAGERAAARGARRIFLEVAEDNAAAHALYASAGFVEVGRRKGYYARPAGAADALVLALSLSS